MLSVQEPAGSYRLQFSSHFRFEDAYRLVPYLDALGITACYTSPLLQSCPGSTHGYDICDHDRLNRDLGSDQDFELFAGALRERGMGLILDVVPNHMGLDASANLWWHDVLAHGSRSPYASYFDIEWNPAAPELKGKVLLPILEAGYGEVLHRGDLKLGFEAGSLYLGYFDRKLPLEPRSAKAVMASLAPPIDRSLDEFNGTPGVPASFDRLHELLEKQHYRLAHWKTAFDEINYRRFFDINGLGSLRIEEPRVFTATHELILALIARGFVTGLRIDHPDGLLDPGGYFEVLARTISVLRGTDRIPSSEPFYVVAEKILSRGEVLPDDWLIAGTTGYSFLNGVNGLFVDPANEETLRSLYVRLTGRPTPYEDVAADSKRLAMHSSLASEVGVLATRLKSIATADRTTRDFTLNTLRRAIVEVIASLPVYRTYINRMGFSAADRQIVDLAIDRARQGNPVLADSAFLFLRGVLLAEDGDACARVDLYRQFAMKFQQLSAPVQAKGIEDTCFYRYNLLLSLNEVGGDPGRFGVSPEEFHEANRVRLERWPREMIATATHDTKRGEDARARLNVLTEMAAEWLEALASWRAINASHRTAVDRETAPDANDEYLFYQTLLGAWPAEAAGAPIPTEAPPEFVARVDAQMQKAIKEAKTHTSWFNQNTAYEDAVSRFVNSTLAGPSAPAFLEAFVPFARRVARAGMVNALAQLILKIASPGIPDFYQGTELWHLDMADPDNRRPVDFGCRAAMLDRLMPWIQRTEAQDVQPHVEDDVAERDAFLRQLLVNWPDGRLKMFLMACALRHRRRESALFLRGEYTPLRAEGADAEHLVAFARCEGGTATLVVVPRLASAKALAYPALDPGDDWGDTCVVVPEHLSGIAFRSLFTGARLRPVDGHLAASAIFRASPVALLVAERLTGDHEESG
jgi:(1->4)-alpha-D-glucan 1-alpha-D-glucosylmutase